jgi:hypothetical protein
MAEQRKLPLVVVLVRELGVDEVALVAALRKQSAQIPIATRQSMIPDDLEAKRSARVGLLVAKGVVTEAELAEALRKAKG